MAPVPPLPARAWREIAAVVLASLLVCGCSASRLSGIVDLARPNTARAGPIDPASVTFAFEPFRGIPGNVGDNLMRQIARAARAEELRLVRRPGAPATYRVEAYLSAISDETNSVVFYAFDIENADGARLHRISGQQTSAPSLGDPWSGVESQALRLIAERLVAEMGAWLAAAAT